MVSDIVCGSFHLVDFNRLHLYEPTTRGHCYNKQNLSRSVWEPIATARLQNKSVTLYPTGL